MKNPGLLSEERFDIFKEDVKSVMHLHYEVKEGAPVLKSKGRKLYNIKGQVLRSEDFELDDSGKLNSDFEIRFDKNGNRLGIDYFIRGEHYNSVKFLLDEKGRMKNIFYDDELEPSYLYVYDDINHTKEVFFHSKGAYDTHWRHEYDENGFVVRSLNIIGMKRASGPDIFEITTYINDSKGNILEEKVINAVSEKVNTFVTYVLNEQGDEIERIMYLIVYGHSSSKYEYKYDHKGNWVIRKTFRSDGRLWHEDERIITYHSDSI
jgi:hypothetical protein